MAALPYMLFYPADYLVDTTHLSLEEHGAYLLMIMNYWQRGGPLPDDDKKLASICRTSVENWLNIRSTLVELFIVDNGLWNHKRIDNELMIAGNKIKKAVRAGKASAAKRLMSKAVESKEEFNTRSTISNRLVKEEKKNTPPKPCGLGLFEDFWKIYPRKVGKGDAIKAWKKIKQPKETLVLITSAISWQKQSEDWTKDGGKFIPHPATYLNGERWLDEPTSNNEEDIFSRLAREQRG